MIPDWPSLWAREPGLRPLDDDGLIELSALRGGSPLARWPDSIWERAYSALCRDAAVRWLTSSWRNLTIERDRHDVTITTEDTMNPWGMRIPMDGEQADSLDAALFAACVAVLDARDATKSVQETG